MLKNTHLGQAVTELQARSSFITFPYITQRTCDGRLTPSQGCQLAEGVDMMKAHGNWTTDLQL
jgi:hypothetical protein